MSLAHLAVKDRRGGGLYSESQSRSDCYPILLNMNSHSREATTVTPCYKYEQPQSRSDLYCYPIRLNMQSHSREATVIPRRRGVAGSLIYVWNDHNS